MLETFKIKDARFSDYESLNALFARCNDEHCAMRPDLYRPVQIVIPKFKYYLLLAWQNAGKLEKQTMALKIAEHENAIVGAAFIQSETRSALSWSAFEKQAYVDNVVVRPDFRRQGIGTALLASAKQWAKQTGHAHMWGKILNRNTASLALAHKCGFTVDSTNIGRHLSQD